MKKLILTALMLILPLVGCEKDEEKKCDCDECPCEQIRDAEPEMEDGDMGLEGGAEQEDLPAGGQDASGGMEQDDEEEGGEQMEEPVLPVAGEMMPEEDCGEMPEDEEMCVPEMMPEEDPEEDEVVDCECESSEDCEC